MDDLKWSFDEELNVHKASKTCSVTGREYAVFLTDEQYKAIYTKKESIKTVVPTLSVDDRYFLISGLTEEEWNDKFNKGAWIYIKSHP
ncbi:MAG: hypothetical protein V3S79_00965 [Candidatus Thermoplasmatota archaeon]